MTFKDIFTIRRITRAIHGGMGLEQGDGCDIEDEILQFGVAPHVWLSIRLSTTVETNKNKYIFSATQNYQWKLK